MSAYSILGSVLEAGAIDHTGEVLAAPSQDSFLSFKVIVSNLSIHSSLPLPCTPQALVLLLQRAPPFGRWACTLSGTPSFQYCWRLLLERHRNFHFYLVGPLIGPLEGPYDHVAALVFDAGRTVTEALATLGALVWLLPSVCAPVLHQIGAAWELLPAEAAHMKAAGLCWLGPGAGLRGSGAQEVMWPQQTRRGLQQGLLAPVCAQVLNTSRAVGETLAALGAEVRLLARVHAVVLHQVGGSSEALATLRTLMGLVRIIGRWGLPCLRDPGLWLQARQAKRPLT